MVKCEADMGSCNKEAKYLLHNFMGDLYVCKEHKDKYYSYVSTYELLTESKEVTKN